MKRGLSLGFGVVLLLLVAIALIGLMRMRAMEGELQDVLDHASLKTANIEAMRNAVQQRRYSLSMSTVLADEIEVAEEWERYNRAASAYLTARSGLGKSGLDPEEKAAIVRLDALTRIAQPMQQRVLDLLDAEGKDVAREYLISAARPAQQEVIDQIELLHGIEHSLSTAAARQIQASNRTGFAITALLCAGAVVLGGLIAIGVGRRTVAQAAEVEYQQRRFQSLFVANMDAVLLWDNLRLMQCNPAAVEMFSLAQGCDPRIHLQDILPEQQADGQISRTVVGEHFARAVEGGEARFECELQRLDGTRFPAEVLLNRVMIDQAPVHQMMVRDIGERRESERKIEYLAYHDQLTDLPNRSLLDDRLSMIIRQAARAERKAAVLHINIKGFKHINESLGHEAGDRLLTETADRLRTLAQKGDTLARLGADEFVWVCSHLQSVGEAARIAEEVLATLAEPFDIDGHDIRCAANVGIALYPQDGVTAEELQKNAASAVHRLREEGGEGYRLFTEAMNAYALRRMKLESGIRKGMEEGEFQVFYQPEIAAESGALVGMEALARWNHPEFGWLEPGEFIPLAEETALIYLLGEWVLRSACAYAQQLREAGHRDLRVAVNLSPKQFRDEQLTETVRGILAQTGLPADLLELEITETAALSSSVNTLRILGDLKSLGIHIAIDDFGTGYSSLSYLNRLPVDTLKIDKSFVRDIEHNHDHAEVTALIIALAHKLGLSVVAEGVETEGHLELLREQACDVVQGHYLARPMPLDELETYIKRQAA